MADGTLIQEREIDKVPSTRRNPLIAEIFHRLDYIERRGSGFQKILNTTSELYGYTEEYKPVFKSTPTAFHVILKNMNYNNLVGDLAATHQDTHQERIVELVEYCITPRTRDELQHFIGLTDRGHFRVKILKPLLESGKLRMTIPDKPNSKNQRYVKA
jgi:ATP-dependent DNA helicase RecG